MKRLSPNPDNNKTLARLIRIALRHWDQEKSWQAITAMQSRGSEQTLVSLKTLARSPSWRRRALGLYVASQLRERRARESNAYALDATQQLLLEGLHDRHVAVVRAAVSGIGHRPHPAALMDLVRWSSHHDAQLRWQVAVALGNYEEPAALEVLLRLATDQDSAVRDWATFGLGSLQSADTPEIRAVLWQNLSDPDPDVRGEALIGLAERHDPRVLDCLLKQLNPACRVYELDAAHVLADHRLLGPLQAIADALSADE